MSDEAENGNFILIDEFLRHEALDRCLMISDILNTHLCEHPFIQANEDLLEKVQDNLDELLEIYQKIGDTEIKEGRKFYFDEIEIEEEDDEEKTAEKPE